MPDPTQHEQPVQAVPDPILCSPYVEPSRHWLYANGVPSINPGRRAAGYYYKSKQTGESQQEFFREENRDDLPLVNRLRADVGRWRESGYRGASEVTKELLRHWTDPRRSRRLFFCQREAVETIIYLLEIRIPGRTRATGFQKFELDDEDLSRLLRGEKPRFDLSQTTIFPTLADQPADGAMLPLRRLGCKMATGAGKTVVMSMLIAWAFCNRGRHPDSTEFPNGVLVCAPNLTVKSRLQVLRPDAPDNYYEQFDIIPARFREYLRMGRVLVTNWHLFAPKPANKEGDATYRVVDKGEEDNVAFTLDRLGDLAQRLPIMVLNDEGHHCWRPKAADDEGEEAIDATREERQVLEREIEEARIWLDGLDRINNSGRLGKDAEGRVRPCVLATVDLSATPFYIGGSGHMEGSPFPWLVSDFGLVDAIESGITKIPRIPVMQEGGQQVKDAAGRADPKYFRLWEHMKRQFKPKDKQGAGYKPEAIYREAEDALLTIAGQWKQRYDQYRRASETEQVIPPAMIVVCPDTATSKLFFEKISGEREVEEKGDDGKTRTKTVYENGSVLPEFVNADGVRHTIRIDTAFEQALRSDEEASKDEKINELRRIVDTVGKVGQPGEHVRCLVSVGKLTEGWDANNVTQVLGIRAFGSQLLCEQVVGRGLRRRSYTTYKPGGKPGEELLEPEYVDVYGIPFSLIPFKGREKEEEAPEDKPKNQVSPVEARRDLEIRAPRVEGYVYGLRSGTISCDVSTLESFRVDEVPNAVYVNVVRGYNDAAEGGAAEDFMRQDRESYYEQVQVQSIHFHITRLVVDRLVEGATAEEEDDRSAEERTVLRLTAKHTLFPQVLRILKEYVSTRISFGPGVNEKEIGLERYVTRIVEQLTNGITPAAAADDAPLLPVLNMMHKYHTTADAGETTTLPVLTVEKSHLNGVAYRSVPERQAAEVLELSPAVRSFVANTRGFGLRIPYEYDGQERVYEPDFIVRLVTGKTILVEIKGLGGELHDPNAVPAKSQATRKWVDAVNNAKRYGEWGFEMCRDVSELEGMLLAHMPSQPLPFERVEPAEAEKFRTCVPLVSLRMAAGGLSESQEGDGPTLWDCREWVRYGEREFEEGMFVAQVRGRSMEPRIPDGAHCLFRVPRAGSRQGRLLVVQHHGIADAAYGGRFTFKKYESEKEMDEETGEWRHVTIRLVPLNDEFPTIELKGNEEEEFRVVAEFVEVVG
jgi:type III restriction enzyme